MIKFHPNYEYNPNILLGKGTTGNVYKGIILVLNKGVSNIDQNSVAVKVIDLR